MGRRRRPASTRRTLASLTARLVRYTVRTERSGRCAAVLARCQSCLRILCDTYFGSWWMWPRLLSSSTGKKLRSYFRICNLLSKSLCKWIRGRRQRSVCTSTQIESRFEIDGAQEATRIDSTVGRVSRGSTYELYRPDAAIGAVRRGAGATLETFAELL